MFTNFHHTSASNLYIVIKSLVRSYECGIPNTTFDNELMIYQNNKLKIVIYLKIICFWKTNLSRE